MSSSVSRAGEPEVDEADPAVVEHEDVGRMRIAVEEPVPEDHRHPGVRHPVGELAALLVATASRGRGRGPASPRATRASAPGPSCTATRRAARRRARRRRSCGGTSRRCAPRAGSRAPGGSSGRTRRRARSASMKSSAARARGRRARPSRISCRSDSICRGAFGRCTLTTTSRAVRQRRAVHLPDRGGRDRPLVEARNACSTVSPSSASNDRADLRRTGTA